MDDSMLSKNIKALEKATVCNTKYTSQFHGTGTEIRYQDPSALPWSKMATETTGKKVYTAISTISHCVSRVWRWVLGER